jgi:hypothetical protein
MRIVISGPAAAYEQAKPRAEIVDRALLSGLHGLAVPGGRCTDYLDDPVFDEIDLTGGEIRTAFDKISSRLHVITEYSSPRRLADAELAALLRYTYGQWSDGLGENGMRATVNDRAITIDLTPGALADATARQVDEQPAPPARFTKLFAAIRRGDLAMLRAAIDAGDQPDVRKSSMPALHWAIVFGHAPAALLLMESGADVTARDGTNATALACCAAARALSDDDAVGVATELLRRGLNGAAFAGDRERARELAEDRDKTRLAALLSQPGN